MGGDGKVAFLLDGREVHATAGESLLEAARHAGVNVPSLCGADAGNPHHPCRVCLVEVDGRVVTACDFPVTGFIRVVTGGEGIERLRRGVVRLHLAADPAAQPLRDLAARVGITGTGGLRSADPGDRCVMCGLCPGVCMDLDGPVRVAPRFEEWRKCIAIERLRSAWGEDRPCRWSLVGLVPGAICSHDYVCRLCPFDHEMFDRAGGLHPTSLLRRRTVRG